jgi:HNH endonuclease
MTAGKDRHILWSDNMKTCITCKEEKEDLFFYKGKNECKKCKNNRSMKHYCDHKDELDIYDSLVCRQPEIIKKFIQSISFPEKLNECWIWIKGTDSKGYGRFYIGRKSLGAHRVSYMIFKGNIDDGLCACHTCDTPECVNPDHLWLGTMQENTQDMIKKGRSKQFVKGHKIRSGGRPRKNR